MAADNCDIKPTDTVAVWGCGPVGLFAVQSAFALGAHRVIAIDHYPHRLDLAKSMGAEVINFEEVEVREALVEMTGGIGPDACIDAVGMESHGVTADSVRDKVKAAKPTSRSICRNCSKWFWKENSIPAFSLATE
jgi:threonine dehydrogenase-like Zn-dependent dehydrogenase